MQENSEEMTAGPFPLSALFKELAHKRQPPSYLVRKVTTQDFKCFYCDHTWKHYFQTKGGKVLITNERCELYSRATLDHVIPRCHGGEDKDHNIVIACYRCNNLKGNTYLQSRDEFTRYRAYETIDSLYYIHFTKNNRFQDPWYLESFEGVCVLSRVKRNLSRLNEYSDLCIEPVELPEDLRYLVQLVNQ